MKLKIIKCNIRELRQRKGMSGYRLAKLLGHTDQSAISRIELMKRMPSIETALGIAGILGCDVKDLYETNETQNM